MINKKHIIKLHSTILIITLLFSPLINNINAEHINIDVGVVSINSPTGILPTGLHTINATVENFGDAAQDVLVYCEIKETESQAQGNN